MVASRSLVESLVFSAVRGFTRRVLDSGVFGLPGAPSRPSCSV